MRWTPWIQVLTLMLQGTVQMVTSIQAIYRSFSGILILPESLCCTCWKIVMRDRPNQFPSCIFILDVRTKPSHSTGTIFECVLSKFKMVISIADIPGLGSSHKPTFHARHHSSTRGRFYCSSIMFIVNWISFPHIFIKVTLNIWPNLTSFYHNSLIPLSIK